MVLTLGAVQEQSAENILFLVELKELSTIPFRKDPSYYHSRIRKVKRVLSHACAVPDASLCAAVCLLAQAFRMYCADGANNQVNLSCRTRRVLEQKVAVPHGEDLNDGVFDDAKAQILAVVHRNTFTRFMLSKDIDSAIENQVQYSRHVWVVGCI